MTMSHTEGRLTPDEPTSVIARKSDTESDMLDVDAPTAKLSNPPPVEPPSTMAESNFPMHTDRVATAMLAMPKPGETAYGFQLVREIGSGAFGRVFLATQENLAGRFVVLKVSADLAGESRALAKLQHTNIVPVYSVHRSGPLQAVCMPYFGTTTLQNLLRQYRENAAIPATGRAFVDTFRFLNTSRQVLPEGPESHPRERHEESTTDAVFGLLASVSYVRAIVWLAIRLTDGMAHAHDRGIIHRDIKPANILLTVDGQPMLLDFGVSEELLLRASVPNPTLGGTLAYMAPEHLREVITGLPSADARSDIYSLGIVLYELLTGQYPFRMPTESTSAAVKQLIEERKAGPLKSIRTFNRDVSYGLESIILKCLAFEPFDRYATATDLREDLHRYLNDQPLKFASERSVRERIQKWRRRHPYLTSTTMIGALLGVILLSVGAGAWANRSRLVRLEAEQVYREFREEAHEAKQFLHVDPADLPSLARGVEKGRLALAKFGANEPDWERKRHVAVLSAEQRDELRRELVDLHLMLARGHWIRAIAQKPADRGEMDEAVQSNARAGELAGDDPPRLLYIQRETMFKRLGRADDLGVAVTALAVTPAQTARDYHQAATVELDAGRYEAAIQLFHKSQTLNPKAVWPYYCEGVCQLSLGQWAAARGCFTSVLALDSDSTFAKYNRGLAQLRLGDNRAAEQDMTAVLLTQPTFADAFLVRAEAREKLQLYAEALADADAAMGNGAAHTRVLPLRAKLRKLTGDAAGAEADLADPSNEDGWIHRGIDLLATDKVAALKAFDRAVALNPKSPATHLYRAHVLGETGRILECLDALSTVIALDPKNVSAIASRGVMHARLGKYPEALVDARTALDASFAPITAYQVACIYAHVSKGDIAYRAEALALLGIALRAGFGHDYVETDTDFDPIRSIPEFVALLKKARRDLPAPKK